MNTMQDNIEDAIDQNANNIGGQDYDATSTYDVGDIVKYQGQLYICTTAITTAEAWNSNHWQATDVLSSAGGNEIAIGTSSDITGKTKIFVEESTQRLKYKDSTTGQFEDIAGDEVFIGDEEDAPDSTKLLVDTEDDSWNNIGTEVVDTLSGNEANRAPSVRAVNEALENTKNDFKNAGAHNSLYRGKDITSLFYDGTLSKQIAAGTFDDIFVGDYIIGKVSGRKYLVADLNYRLHTGDTECTTPHVLMIPEKIMGTAKMNDSNITTGGYVGSKMYTEYLTPFKTVINNDFGSGHILSHRQYLKNAVTNGYESAGDWKDSTIELMNELMVYGSNIFHNIQHGTNVPQSHTIDKSQLSLFRLDKSKIVARNDNNERFWYWLRDVASSSNFAFVGTNGLAHNDAAFYTNGVRPAFLIY